MMGERNMLRELNMKRDKYKILFKKQIKCTRVQLGTYGNNACEKY